VDIHQLEGWARRIRQRILAMGCLAGGTHFGPSFSAAEILAVLYGAILNVHPGNIESEDRDRFVLSKGHASAALLAALAEKKILDPETLRSYCREGSPYGGHLDMLKVKGVEASTGALGHGFGFACGMAYAAKLRGKPYRTYVLLGDGECQEGSVWETAMCASQQGLDRLVAVIDYNRLQGMGFVSDICKLEPFGARWKSFGWGVREVNGHDLAEIYDALAKTPLEKDRPTAIIARTVKGKGVSFMENKAIWHYRLPNEEELRTACRELAIEDIERILS
jgi:transketolase